MSLTESTMLALGTVAPEFALTNVITGTTVSPDNFRGREALLVMFICAHCPYVKHINQGLGALGKDYATKSLAILAISSNDAATHPADSPEGLKQQAETFGFNFPYLYDETQEVARAYKAACTPDFFLFDADSRLVYRGQFDSSRRITSRSRARTCARPSTGLWRERLRSRISTLRSGAISSGKRRSRAAVENALMRVAVMAAGTGGHIFHGDHAAVQFLATLVLKLEGGVADLEVLPEHMVELDQDAGAL